MSKEKINLGFVFIILLFLSSCLSPQIQLPEEPALDYWDYYLQRYDLGYPNGRRKCNVTISKNFQSNIQIKNMKHIILVISHVGDLNEKCTDFEIEEAHYANDVLKVKIHQKKWNEYYRSSDRVFSDYYFIENPTEWALFLIRHGTEYYLFD